MAKKNNVTYIGTGRRKSSVARVFMTPGTGTITVNGKTLDEYLPLETLITQTTINTMKQDGVCPIALHMFTAAARNS